MINLNDWFNRHAKIPIVRLIVAALGLQFLYFAYLTYSRYSTQIERIGQMAEVITLGIQQSNRPLVESALTSALLNSDVVFAAVCDGGVPSISYPPSYVEYCRKLARNPWRWSMRAPLNGMQGLDFVVVFCPLSTFGPLFFLMFITMVMLALIMRTISVVRKQLESELLIPLGGGLIGESSLQVVELEDLRLKNLEHTQLIRKQAVSDAMIQLAAQVAHDIRSPLAALGAATKGLDIPGDQRTLVDGAIGRIQGIANDLLARHRAPGAAAARPETCALAPLIEQVLAEKRLQHREKPGIKIEFTSGAAVARAAVDPKELQRIISNLVNNSVEAFSGPGTVTVSLTAYGDKVSIEIRDDGKGISPEILVRLGQKGETHGKTGGTGLGLYHARTSLESWGGRLTVESEPGKGTAVKISLPAAARPPAGRHAVLLDDDPLVHMNWKMAAKVAGAALNAYKTSQALAEAADTLPRDIPLFIDSELGDGIKGEDIAKDLHEKGFTDISMATGHGPEKFAHLPWLKVTGKEPPWA